MIQVRDLVKSFGGHAVLRGLNLDVVQGERLALVGPNGAGKTTLLRILAALSKPTEGSVQVAGMDLGEGQARRVVMTLSSSSCHYRAPVCPFPWS